MPAKKNALNSQVQAGDKRAETIKRVLSDIEKKFGKGSIQLLGKREIEPQPVIPSGSIVLDIALGVGGYPRGRIVEIFGPESSGKTTLALHAIAEAQKAGGIAAFIDAEHALDLTYASNIGIDIANLIIAQPDYGEQALEIAERLMQSGAIDVIVIDSVPALVPKAELEGAMGEAQVGLQARMMSHALRKMVGIINNTKTVCIFVNQLREKIGVMFGNPEVTPGGRALAYYASVRIDVRKIGQLKQDDEVKGIRVRATVKKNKVAPPFRSAEFDIIFNEGISYYGELLDMGVELGIVDKSGAWYSYKNHKLGQGKEAARQFLKEHPEIAKEIDLAIRQQALPHLFKKRAET